jgi:hypothetical protein
MKDGEEGFQWTSELVPVPLGEDRNGEPIASCSMEIASKATKVDEGLQNGSKPKPKLSNDAALALRSLTDTLLDCGTIPPWNSRIPRDTKTCHVDAWRQRFYDQIVGERDIKRDTKRQAFGRGSKELQRLSVIGVWKDQAWVA